MALDVRIQDGNLIVPGNLELSGYLYPALARATSIASETFVDWIPLSDMRVHNTDGQALPATAANDDLALIHGTFGTEPLHVSAGDVKTFNSTRYCRFMRKLKDTYVAGTAVQLTVLCGMQTTVASTTCNIDAEVYWSDADMTMTGDRCTTAAQSMNSLTFATKTFDITSTNFTSTSELDIRLAIIYNDGATATAVEPTILAVGLSQTCKGG